jgi:hypothetical protein
MKLSNTIKELKKDNEWKSNPRPFLFPTKYFTTVPFIEKSARKKSSPING